MKRIPPEAADASVLKFIGTMGATRARLIIDHIASAFRVERYTASNAVTYSLLRLRASGAVTLTGKAKGARYALTEAA